MKKVIFLVIACYAIINIYAQTNTLSKGASLLFKNVKSKLSDKQKNIIFDIFCIIFNRL